MNPTATLLISCPDQKGIVARLSNFVFQHGGNIVDSDHHSDFSRNRFLGRIEWELKDFALSKEELLERLAEVADPMGGSEDRPWQLHYSEDVPRISIWCGKQDHCLLDLLWRHQNGELRAEIPLIISNHVNLQPIAAQFGIPFRYVPLGSHEKAFAEKKALALLKEHRVGLVVLAKYMQVLSDDFLQAFPGVMNIHHSFLPAFAGAQPYHQAHARGVKVIGATAHYVTPDLDAGPIIEQDIIRVSHRDTVEDLVRKGKDLERTVLSRAVRLHLQHRLSVPTAAQYDEQVRDQDFLLSRRDFQTCGPQALDGVMHDRDSAFDDCLASVNQRQSLLSHQHRLGDFGSVRQIVERHVDHANSRGIDSLL